MTILVKLGNITCAYLNPSSSGKKVEIK